jgi:hypothetical protein
MHARALVRSAAALAAAILGTTLLATTPAHAADADPLAPVVVDDTITLWPGQSRTIDVLANDTNPTDDDLALCRLPVADLSDGRVPRIMVDDLSPFGEPAGTLLVSTLPRAHGTMTVQYYVCNTTRLTPATLTVVIRDVQQVQAGVADRRAHIEVTNPNSTKVRIIASDKDNQVCGAQILGGVRPTLTREFRVHQHSVRWVAVIGQGGVAGHGRIRDIPLPRRSTDVAGTRKGDRAECEAVYSLAFGDSTLTSDSGGFGSPARRLHRLLG